VTPPETAPPLPPGPPIHRTMAAGRFLLGVTSLVAPRSFARAVGVEAAPSTVYMTRVYGARAVAMGLSYLTSSPETQARWERLGLAIDLSDTAAGVAHLLRRDVPPRAAVAMVALTGGYALAGATSLRRAFT